MVTGSGVQCDLDKISAVRDWPTPKTVMGVRSFLGFVNYNRRYFKGFAQVAAPITALTQKGKSFDWTQNCQSAFEFLTTKLIEAPILAYPIQDEGPHLFWILTPALLALAVLYPKFRRGRSE